MDERDEDLGAFDPNIPEEGPSAPPPGWLDDIHGYQGHKGAQDDNPLYPPPPAYNPQPELNRNTLVPNYRLETYTETRTSAWQFEPYNGEMVDGPQYGVSPQPWDVQVVFPQKFTDVVEKIPVNDKLVDITVKPELVRSELYGEIKHLHICTAWCISCQGHGHKTCSVCHGSQNLLHFILLTVTWKNNVEEFIPDRQPDFPDKKFEKVTGDPFFIDENVLVYPIQGFPDQEICDISTNLINSHLNRFSSTSRILQQRQTIELVPLTQAFYFYNGKVFDFFVYGIENRVNRHRPVRPEPPHRVQKHNQSQNQKQDQDRDHNLLLLLKWNKLRGLRARHRPGAGHGLEHVKHLQATEPQISADVDSGDFKLSLQGKR
ncbi:hypothetical protein INR49_002405 [Caranx melampygus]|nr:hypothetical protein INR49_002405 [Caranx melampygus]